MSIFSKFLSLITDKQVQAITNANNPNMGNVFLTQADLTANNNSSLRLLGTKIGFNMNSTADQAITLSGGSVFIITDTVITNPSTNITTALDFEIYSAVSRGGNQLITSTGISPLQKLTVASSFINSSSQSIRVPATVYTVQGTTVYASLGTPQGAAATADVYVYGYILS